VGLIESFIIRLSSYGAFSISQKQLKHVVEYVVNQKEHHRKQTLIPIFERQ